MHSFTPLYIALDATNSSTDKRRLLREYFAERKGDAEDAAIALFFLTGNRLHRTASTKLLRKAIVEATGLPTWLVGECREQVGDLSETLALLHPGTAGPSAESLAATWKERLQPFQHAADDERRRSIIERAWNDFDADQRLVFHKLIRGGFRVGVQRRTVAHALADLSGLDVAVIQQRLTGGVQPTAAFFESLLSGDAQPTDGATPYPFCLANPIDPLPRERTPATRDSDAEAPRADSSADDTGREASGGGCADPPNTPLLQAEAVWVAEQLGPPGEYQCEYKYDGIRAQLIARAGAPITLFSRGEELVTEQFPEIVAAARDAFAHDDAAPTAPTDSTDSAHSAGGFVLDGELLMAEGSRLLPFFELQTRLNRKPSSLAQPSLFDARSPVFIAYDVLEHRGVDLRDRPTSERRTVLERTLATLPAEHTIRLAPLADAEIAEPTWADRVRLRVGSRERGVEGLMLKHVAAPYHTGRTRSGPTWWKWKVDPFSVDAVLIYAQPGTGRRATLFTDYTFALRVPDGRGVGGQSKAGRGAGEGAGEGGEAARRDAEPGKRPSDADQPPLVAFAKAYSGLKQEEIEHVDRFVRQNTIDKMGPVRAVKPALVMEIGFESVQRSDRHASGLAVRFPRILRLRPDKTPAEADSIEAVERLAPNSG